MHANGSSSEEYTLLLDFERILKGKRLCLAKGILVQKSENVESILSS